MINAKDGRVESPVFLAWARTQGCRVQEEAKDAHEHEECAGPIDPHHVDGKGIGGARCRDDRVIPLCRKHHDQAHDLKGPERALLLAWADESRSRFLDRASVPELRQYVEDLIRWKERPMAIAL